MGTPAFAVPVLERLLGAGHEIVGVYTQPDKPAGRGKKMQPPPVKEFAEAQGLRVLQPGSLKGAIAQTEFAGLKSDAAVVAAYGKLLPKAVLNAPRLGCLNIHPSLLPRHRGASPVATAILQGDETTGVTVMLLDEGLDTGPLLAQAKTPIGPEDGTPAMTRRLFDMGADLLIEALAGLDAGKLKPQPQDEEQATLSKRLSREDGHIGWKVSADDIARKVRAYHPWPGTFTAWGDKTVKMLEATATPRIAGDTRKPGTVTVTDGQIEVATGFGSLVVTRLQLEGRKAVSAPEFLTGHADFAGAVLGQAPQPPSPEKPRSTESSL
jgi:methionyl-tRNA formyltransferase